MLMESNLALSYSKNSMSFLSKISSTNKKKKPFVNEWKLQAEDKNIDINNIKYLI